MNADALIELVLKKVPQPARPLEHERAVANG
jgi:hypothetical protein